MTQFDITYTDFKREDTTNDITIKLYADNKRPIIPDASHTWKAKVAKGDKYVGEYPVTIFGNVIKLSSSNLTRLPDGIYALELWETYDGSTAIYPSTGTMEFRVHENIDDTLGTIDPTTDINAIIDDLHKAGQNIKVVATNTLPAGSKASVTQAINNGENQLTFNIPQGEQGNVGPAPTLKIGVVAKLSPNQTPTASFSGGNGAYTLDLGIPQGAKGENGNDGKSAYQIWLDAGNSGTEQDFINSLKAPSVAPTKRVATSLFVDMNDSKNIIGRFDNGCWVEMRTMASWVPLYATGSAGYGSVTLQSFVHDQCWCNVLSYINGFMTVSAMQKATPAQFELWKSCVVHEPYADVDQYDWSACRITSTGSDVGEVDFAKMMFAVGLFTESTILSLGATKKS